MTVAECYQYVQLRLNKISTNSNDNIPIFAFVSAFNTQQMLWAEDRFKINENNIVRIDELNHLLKSVDKPLVSIGGTNRYLEFELPQDYFHYSTSTSLTPCELRNHLVKEGNINTLLLDENWKPSLEWGETIATIVGKKLRVYIDGFTVSGVNLTYYRFPKDINMASGFNDVNNNTTIDVDPELIGASLIEVLNMTCELLAGDTQDQWNQQISSQRSQRHT